MQDRVSRIRLLKQLYRQFGLYFYILLAALLILLGVSKHPLISRVRIEIADVSSSVVNVLHKPIEAVGYVGDLLKEYIAVYHQNAKLRQENQKLLYWVNRAEQLASENKMLKKQLNFVPSMPYRSWTGYIAADNGGVFSRSVLVKLGRKNGIQRGFVALYNDGVLGRVEAVGDSTSQVLLLTDYVSRVPVFVGKNRIMGIAEGQNSPMLKLTALPEDAQINVGDYVSTSGLGGVYPQALAVGVVSQVAEDEILIKPFVTREDTPFLRIVDYGTAGLLDTACDCSKECAAQHSGCTCGEKCTCAQKGNGKCMCGAETGKCACGKECKCGAEGEKSSKAVPIKNAQAPTQAPTSMDHSKGKSR